MNNYVQCQNCQYYLSGTCAYYEQPLDHYPDEDITCTDYAPKRDYCEQINNISVPMSQVPEEIKQQWIQEYYEPPYREPFGNDDYDAPDFSNYVQEEPDDY